MKRKWVFIVGLTIISLNILGQDAKIKTVFIYNFTNYIQWPENYNSGDFVIGVYGDSPMINELNSLATKRKVGGQTIKVKKFNTIGEIQNCHILFIESGKSSEITGIINKIVGNNTLLISEKAGMTNKLSAYR